MKVLITGGAGFIGSTIASAMIDRDIEPIILDDLSTGRREFTTGRVFYEGDIADGHLVDRIFDEHPGIFATIHCAAVIVVPESVEKPLHYYRQNVSKTVDLVEHLARNGCRRLLFSSSAAIYEPGDDFSVDETATIAPTSPYGRTKAMIEQILEDVAATGNVTTVSLRYFNPVGADPKLRTGLQIRNPSHALGKMIEAWETGTKFNITGVDWPTRDGTGIRDYIHVWDLADAHVDAVENFDTVIASGELPGYQVINLGTGDGTTVRELVAAFSTVIGSPLPCLDTAPRPGDTVGAFTRSDRSASLLHWQPRYSIEDGIRHALAWRELDNDRLTVD